MSASDATPDPVAVPAAVIVGDDAARAVSLRALSAWASARGISLLEPTADASPPVAVSLLTATSWEASERAESALGRAKDALLALDGEQVDAATDEAERALRAAPELLHAAWLMAEVWRTRAARHARVAPKDLALAASEVAMASSLDGGRAPGLGESSPPWPEAPAPSVVLPVTLDEMADGDAPPPTAGGGHPAGSGTRVFVDGRPVPLDGGRGTVSTPAGTHLVHRIDEGRVRVARWESLTSGSTLVIAPPLPPPCERGDIDAARAAARRGESPEQRVRCGHWLLARESSDHRALVVSECSAGHCGPTARIELSGERPSAYTDTERTAASDLAHVADTRNGKRPVAPWVVWSLVGIGVLGAAGAVLVASGVFRTATVETRFTSGGVQVSPAALRF